MMRTLLCLIFAAGLACPEGLIRGARLIWQVEPEYPLAARQAGIQDIVRLRVVVSKDGAVAKVIPVRGHSLLLPAAVAAVRQWRYSPAILNGEPVELTLDVELAFPATLRDDPSKHCCDFSAENPTRISWDWESRGVRRKVPPEYPASARKAGISGLVTVAVLVNREGKAVKACASGPKALRYAAETDALQWEFNTPALNGDKFPYLVAHAVFNFVLDGKPPQRKKTR